MMTDKLKLAWRSALTALIPCCCALCREDSRDVVCAACHQSYFSNEKLRCLQCALPLPDQANSARCGDCLRNPPAFDFSITACDYAAPQDQLVQALKFGHQLALAPWFASRLRDAILRQKAFDLPDLLCAVPLGPQRLSERGFNQAHEIARPLSRQLGIPLSIALLQRSRETEMQSNLSQTDRASNVRQAFSVGEHMLDSINGLHIGIVDDVMTTGMTLHEIATMLKRFGAARVSTYIFARTLPYIN